MNTERIEKKKDGDCFQNVQDYVLDNDSPTLIVVHGKVTNKENKVLAHAWIEDGDIVLDPTTGIKTTKEKYYRALKAVPENKYNPMDAIKIRFKTGNYGPWTAEEINENDMKEKPEDKEILVGTEEEKEHTDDDKEAEGIATDHTDTDKKYYTKLNKCGLIDEPKAKKLADKYLMNEHQLKIIGENIISEIPEQFTKGDKIQLLSPIDGYLVPPKSFGEIIHVDALGTARTEFIVNGQKVIVPVNPDVDEIIKVDEQPLITEEFGSDNRWSKGDKVICKNNDGVEKYLSLNKEYVLLDNDYQRELYGNFWVRIIDDYKQNSSYSKERFIKQ